MTRPVKIGIGYGVILLWMFLPMIPVFIAAAIASHYGCQVDEGGTHPCIVFGKDIGGKLYEMGVMGWFGLLTFPSGLLALLLFSVVVVRHLFKSGQ
ncbi:MAG TPA: hypothetical protein VKV04_13530 [Verrucomicrobiae bacterium]|nr:hypothetical protein [Verrucomicrobiae bacterium]